MTARVILRANVLCKLACIAMHAYPFVGARMGRTFQVTEAGPSRMKTATCTLVTDWVCASMSRIICERHFESVTQLIWKKEIT